MSEKKFRRLGGEPMSATCAAIRLEGAAHALRRACGSCLVATATVSCSGGSGFVVDANALFGQQTETAAFNAAPPEETCQVKLDTP